MRFIILALTAVGTFAVESTPAPSPVDQLPQTIRTQLVQTTGGATIVDVQVDQRNGDPQYVARYRDTASGEMKTVRLGKMGNVIDQGTSGTSGITSDKKRTETAPNNNDHGAVVIPRPTAPTTATDPQPLTDPGRTNATGTGKTESNANASNNRDGMDSNTHPNASNSSTTTPNDADPAKPTDKPSAPSSGSSGKSGATNGTNGGNKAGGGH